jgi:Universal stress protein family
MTDTVKTPPIVVGIDGSEPSKEALRWVIDRAARPGTAVDAIMTWEYPTEYGWAPILDAEALVKGSEQALAETAAAVAGDNPRYRRRPVSSKATPPTCSSGNPPTRSCWSSTAAATVGSSGCCSARSAGTASSTPGDRWSSSTPTCSPARVDPHALVTGTSRCPGPGAGADRPPAVTPSAGPGRA